jgi:phosphatidylserine/phosphatidylglycerophosphate/cardiolipin synthase-like enzyme
VEHQDCATGCDLGLGDPLVFVDEAAEDGPTFYPFLGDVGHRVVGSGGWSWSEPEVGGMITEVHQEIADLLGGHGPSGFDLDWADAGRLPAGAEQVDLNRKILIMLTAVLAAGASGCSSAVSQQTAQPTASSPSPGPAPSASTDAPGTVHHAVRRTGSLRVLTEPQAGIGPIYRLITRARSSVDLSMYELADPTAEADLAADAARGVNVRVILDQHLEKSRNTAAYDYLAAHGVHVRWGPAGTTYHQKTLTVDDTASVIMTLNLVAEDYPGTRDFAVIDTNRADVAAIVATFSADFAGRAITPPDGTDLVWSPTNAEASVLSVINGAARTLAVEDEEMDDPAVTSALAAAAQRGVNITITMTADPEWDQAFTELARAGAHIRLYPDGSSALYIHAKAIVADAGLPGQQALIGSQNFSVASLDYNRELGILTHNPAVVAVVSKTLAGDSADAAPYSPAAASSPAPASGAWCTATASVYSASDDENNVYVHSNEPYQNATATAGGYSHSYETNGSGYALIYLNGPPPGVQITVTVGGATCTTSD